MRRPVKRARAKRRPSANPSLPNSNSPPASGPGNAPGTQRGEATDHSSKVMQMQRRVWVLDLARAGMPVTRICDNASNAKAPAGTSIPLDASEVRTIYTEYLAELKVQYAADIPAARAAQLDRIRNAMIRILSGDVVLYQGVPVPGLRKINWSAYFMAEREMSLILGTHAPKVIAVEVDEALGTTLTKALSGLRHEEFEEIVQKQLALEEDAKKFRGLALVK